MATETSEIYPPTIIAEKDVPEKNLLENFDRLFYGLGYVASKSKRNGFERSLALRAERAQLFKQAKNTPNREERRQIIKEANDRDVIFQNYLEQRQIWINMGNLGEQSSRYVDLLPPQERKKEVEEPPIVIITGISNDIDCVGALARELPMRGRRTIVIGYPESFMGHVTPEFVEAVKASPTFEPHTAYYKAAIEQILPSGDYELWGYSTGGPIVSQMLHDKDISDRVTDAVLLSPASVVTQSMPEFGKGLMHEISEIKKKFPQIPKYTFSTGRKRDEDSAHLSLRKDVSGALLSRVLTGMDLWKDARVKENGKITVISPTGDDTTKCYKVFNKENELELQNENPQIRVINIPGTHITSLVDPESVLDKLWSTE